MTTSDDWWTRPTFTFYLQWIPTALKCLEKVTAGAFKEGECVTRQVGGRGSWRPEFLRILLFISFRFFPFFTTRYNANGKDLNRNFPDFFRGGKNNGDSQPEANAIARWMTQRQFVLSAAFHGGALVASYPFDNKGNGGGLFSGGYQPSLTPDDDTFKHLATMYSFNHRTMHSAGPCFLGDSVFPNGTTNGAAWYYLAGGMQDFNYVWNGVMELTLELGCCKYPKGDQLPELWEDNKLAMIKYISEAHRGVRGQVRDEFGSVVANANVRIKDRSFGSKTTPLGEYWRILMPGVYTLQVKLD